MEEQTVAERDGSQSCYQGVLYPIQASVKAADDRSVSYVDMLTQPRPFLKRCAKLRQYCLRLTFCKMIVRLPIWNARSRRES